MEQSSQNLESLNANGAVLKTPNELCVQQTGLTSSNASKRGCLSMNLQGLMPYGTRVRG